MSNPNQRPNSETRPEKRPEWPPQKQSQPNPSIARALGNLAVKNSGNK
ncbi:hypothetical protein IPM62_05555 [Candidatus Woesebacteria bacterium]|nr:MAG: hypothetical protein IPM62_05555 [Candidatus Woesebacteria bacterium]